MQNKEFISYLIQKLKTGNRASIHLNALPSNYVTRLDLYRLNILTEKESKGVFRNDETIPSLAALFLKNLLNKASFNFDINFWDISLKKHTEEQAKQLQYLAKRFDSMYYQTLDNYLEYGLRTFGFGYPLLIKRDRKDKNKIIKAPLLIWKLEIEKSKKTPNSWTIIKQDDFPIAVNEILVSQIQSDDSIKLDAIPHEFLEDSIIQKEELEILCNTYLNQINRTKDANETAKLEKNPTAKKISETVTEESYIQWSGVFGTYKNQKQSLIKELEDLHGNFDEFDSLEIPELNFESKISGVETDPSQERIVNNFSKDHLKIIQGPPGTGKSQTISAIITNALENKKKCLVICEKKTAIEVIYNNLSKLNIGSLCAVIDDINKDRGRIIQSARSRIENNPPVRFSSHLYERNLNKYEELKHRINNKIAQLKSTCFGDYNHKELVGLFLENVTQIDFQLPEIEINPGNFRFAYDEYEDLLEIIKNACDLSDDAKARKSGLHNIKDEVFLSKPTEKFKFEILEQLNEVFEIILELERALDTNFEKDDEMYDYTSFLKNFKIRTAGLFNKKQTEELEKKKDVWKAYINLNSSYQYIDFLKEQLTHYEDFKNYSELRNYTYKLKEKIKDCIDSYKYFWPFQRWKKIFTSIPRPLQKLIGVIEEYEPKLRLPAFKSWYLNERLTQIYHEEGIEDVEDDLLAIMKLQSDLQIQQTHKIFSFWQQEQEESIENYQTKHKNIKRLYNFRRNKEFGRQNALRKIITADFELFTNLFPVVLTNPVACSSVMPLKPNLFDVVIFDEASQLRVEDTYTSYLRGAYKVISGDRHQMPPSSYFQSGISLNFDDEITEEMEEGAFLAESESLLQYAEENTIRQTHLEFHYRSRHPYLIDFSNAAFYGNRLIPMPATKNYKPIRFIQVEGTYFEGTNETEAIAVVELIANIALHNVGEMPSIGVATTNLNQRDLISFKLSEKTYKDHTFAQNYSRLYANGFFVKNLENIQGDERDIIIISTTFGPDEEGNFRQNFGPLNQKDGYRLLNVIVTRAKEKLYVCSSIPASSYASYKKLIEEKGNNGRGIFYAYLAYANAIENDNETERQNILKFISKHCKESIQHTDNLYVAGPFEKIIKKELSKSIDKERIHSIFKFGGFFLDTAIEGNESEKGLALECNGGIDCLPEEAYVHMQYRKKLLENYGFRYKHLWSLDFWREPQNSLTTIVSDKNNG